jgi:hypothetical protein
MNKEYTDNDIVQLLKKVSTELAPRESSFVLLLQKLKIQKVAPHVSVSPSPYNKGQKSRLLKKKVQLSPYGSILKIASACMAVFVVYIGISNVYTEKKAGDVLSSNTVSENISTNPVENIAVSDTTQTEKAVALLQKNTTQSDVVELSTALESELLAEIEANTDLFAISNSI